MEKIVDIKNFSLKFGDKIIFSNFDFSVSKGEILGIKGNSGIGKTSLFNFICEIGLENADFSFEKKTINGKISCVFQEFRLLENVSAKKNISIPLKSLFQKKEISKIVEKNLEIAGLSGKQNSKCRNLSGGEKQRVSIARAISFPFDILLLDEAFNSIDEKTKFFLMGKVKEIVKNDEKTAILISHNSDELEFFCDRIIEI